MLVSQCQTFESMSYGVSQIQGLSNTLFERVLLYDVFLDLYGQGNQLLKFPIINLIHVEIQQFGPMACGADKPVPQHLGITGQYVGMIQ